MNIREPQPEHKEQEVPPGTSFHFVYCEHTPDMAVEIAKSLRGCEVVALEAIGVSEGDVAKHEALLQSVICGDIPIAQLDGICSDVVYKLVNELQRQGTVKAIRLIDARKEQKDIYDTHREDLYDENISSMARSGDHRRFFRSVIDYAMYSGLSDRRREDLCAYQLLALAGEYPGKRIGVVQGAAHTGTQHVIDRMGIENSRVFVVDELKSARGVIFSPHDTLTRQVAYGAKKLDRRMVLRAIADTLECEGLVDPFGDPYAMTDDQIGQIIAKWQAAQDSTGTVRR
ncbi:hypothetical protein IPM09_04190 [Candidatus Saccharibacteria bacterium]|nr:MAG: hypothetical protein IPM09_04190 [Candidatus Saccharibacteria bacterium]